MVKRVKIEPLATETEVLTNSNLLSALMEQELHVSGTLKGTKPK
jgi:hypothetical protein